MSYKALYRKYRPVTFDDVIGQEHITTTLINQIKSGRISHAYLFTGSRGTGKTTCAKIFAKSVNCLNPIEGSPCLKCDVCKEMEKESSIDILEIDAASNNRVDEIRDLREKVKYLPVKGKKKVYIIDEVHMLTDSAFNALLKTLEEPPAHVVFILATTEAHKLPATILSRCLRFDFRLIQKDELKVRLAEIFKREKKDIDDEALELIALQAEGSVRDMLSIADMCLNYSDKKLTCDDVLTMTGATDKSRIAELFSFISSSEIGNTLKAINELTRAGKSVSLIAKELTNYARDLLMLKTDCDDMVAASSEWIGRLKAESGKHSTDFLITAIGAFSAIDSELRYSLNPKIVLETAAVRVSKLMDADIINLSERIRRLEENGVSVKREAGTESKNEQALQNVSDSDAKIVWGKLTTHFRTLGEMSLYSLIGTHNDYKIENGTLIILAEDSKFLQFCDEKVLISIKDALQNLNLKLKLEVKKPEKGVDMDKEINKIKRMMGGAKLNIEE